MDFNTYQKEAHKTAIYTKNSYVIYSTLGLVSEAGEFSGKIAKLILQGRNFTGNLNPEELDLLMGEAGDILWYLAAVLSDLGLNMEEVALRNLKKVQSRQTRGVLQGSGDDR